jgi:plasmid maintenance system antidote protein VapI
VNNAWKMTERQLAAWPDAIAEINRYHVEASDNPDHPDWHFDWFEETRAGRGQVFSALFIDGEHFAQIFMDVYGSPTVSVAALDIMHNGSDEECPCDFCTKERWDEYSDEELADEYQYALDHNQPVKLAELRAYADSRPTKIIFPSGPSGFQGPIGVVVSPREVTVQDRMFNDRPAAKTNYAVAPGEYLREWMEENFVSARPLANFMSLEQRWLKRFLDGKEPVDDQLARNLEILTKIPAASWLAFEKQYREDKERLKKTFWKRVLASFLRH